MMNHQKSPPTQEVVTTDRQFCDFPKCNCSSGAFERCSHPPTQDLQGLEKALTKINDIRNSIIGLQTMNWSEHIYPLVAALEEAGFKGAGYPASRANVGTMLERTVAAEAIATTLTDAGRNVIAAASDSYKKRNGHRASFEDDSGEKCWIVPFDEFESLRSAVALAVASEGK